MSIESSDDGVGMVAIDHSSKPDESILFITDLAKLEEMIFLNTRGYSKQFMQDAQLRALVDLFGTGRSITRCNGKEIIHIALDEFYGLREPTEPEAGEPMKQNGRSAAYLSFDKTKKHKRHHGKTSR